MPVHNSTTLHHIGRSTIYFYLGHYRCGMAKTITSQVETRNQLLGRRKKYSFQALAIRTPRDGVDSRSNVISHLSLRRILA